MGATIAVLSEPGYDPAAALRLLRVADAAALLIKSADPLPPHVGALLVIGAGPFGLTGETAPAALAEALAAGLPVLGIGWGMQAINVAFHGRPPAPTPDHATPGHAAIAGHSATPAPLTARRRIFLTMGGKVASIIGGAGVVSLACRHSHGLTEARRGKGLMSSAFSVDDGVVEAFEVPGDRWIIGVQWPAHLLDDLPARFENLFAAFVGRASGYSEAGTETA